MLFTYANNAQIIWCAELSSFYHAMRYCYHSVGVPLLETVRNPVLHELVTKLKECDIDFWQLNETKKIQLILDSTTIEKTRKITSASAQRVELLTRRLIFQLHITRYRL